MELSELSLLLSELTDPEGVSGNEFPAAEAAAELLYLYAQSVTVTPRGSVVGQFVTRENAPHLLLDAHIDQIGMMVSRIEKGGFLRCVPVGGLDFRLLCGQKVWIHGKTKTPAVVVTPYTEKPEVLKKEALILDTGLSDEEVNSRISVGDRVTVDAHYDRLAGNSASGGALDDRSGVAAILCALSLVDKEKIPCSVSVLFSSQEEVGLLGAQTEGFRTAPTHAIAVDVSFAKTPDAPAEKCGNLGEGGMIGFSPILDYRLSCKLRDLAKEKGIPYQTEVMGGTTGTNADALALVRGGVTCGLVSIPLRYMHTPIELLELSDIHAVAELLAAAMEQAGDLLWI